jgi:hypothetical protein
MARTVKLSVYGEAERKPKDLLRQKGAYKKDDMREYRRLCRELSKLLFSRKARGKHQGFHGFRSALSRQQQCVVKCRIGKETVARQRFIKEYMPPENKRRVTEKPELFNTETTGKDYPDQYAQAMTRQLCTELIGKRTPEEIQAAVLQSHKSCRYCPTDESIGLYEKPLEQKDEVYETQVRAQNDIMQKRLAFLASLRLAKKAEDKKTLFYLERGWQKKLKAMGRYADFFLKCEFYGEKTS